MKTFGFEVESHRAGKRKKDRPRVMCDTSLLHIAGAVVPAQQWDAVTRLPGGMDVETEPHRASHRRTARRKR